MGGHGSLGASYHATCDGLIGPATLHTVRRLGQILLTSAILLAAGPPGCAGRNPEGTAPRSPAEGPAPFAAAPDFTLPDSAGAPRGLAGLTGPKGLVLVVYRGHW